MRNCAIQGERNGNENSKSAAGNLHARVLIELDGGPLALATPFEEEVV